MKKINLINITTTILFIIVLYFLFQTGAMHKYFVGGATEYFSDWKTNVKWLKCNFLESNIYEICNNFNYGKIFLFLPFNEGLEIFYLNYLPSITIIALLFTINLLINPRNLFELFIFFLAVFNPTTLLLIERLNFDLFIFFILIILSFNKFYFINWLLFCFSFLSKIYPITFGIILFIENKNRTIKSLMLILVLISITIFSYFFLYFEDYLTHNVYKAGGKAGYQALFSLNTIPKLFKYMFQLNYIFSLLLMFSIFCTFIYYISKYFKKNNILNKIDIYSIEGKLFLLGGSILLLCYPIFSNYYYREVFIISALPLLLKFFREKENKFFNYFIFFIVFRYIFLFLYGFVNFEDSVYHVNGIRFFSTSYLITTFIKGILDLILMSIIGSLTILLNVKIVNDLKIKFNSKVNE